MAKPEERVPIGFQFPKDPDNLTRAEEVVIRERIKGAAAEFNRMINLAERYEIGAMVAVRKGRLFVDVVYRRIED